MDANNKQITNLNIPTFIREIYQALKHIDLTMYTLNNTINSRITVLENNQQKIQTRLDELDMVMSKIYDNTKAPMSLNKSIEVQLSEKLSKLNNNSLLSEKIELKPEELTLANIMENNYTFDDIEKSLEKFKDINLDSNLDTLQNVQNDIKKESLDELLF